MNTRTILKGTFIAFCLVAMLVLPAAAAPVAQGTNVKANAIDQGLKDDLWNNHIQNRLAEFDMHVQHATTVIGILNKYGVDTTQMQGTLDTFSGKRAELQTALTNKDKEALKTINSELRELRQEFLQEMKEAIRDHFGKVKAAASTGTTPAGNSASVLPLRPATATV